MKQHFDDLFDAGQYVEAIIVIDELIAQYPNDALAYTNRGLAKGMLGRYEEAIIDFSKVIELRPPANLHPLENVLIIAHYNRGVSHARLGRIDAAHADFAVGLQLAREERDTDWITMLEDAMNFDWPSMGNPTPTPPPPPAR